MATVETIRVVATIMGLGVAAQVIADRLRVPSVLFLSLAGVIVGPEFLGLISPEVFGGALGSIVGLCVAVIVFEGAFHISIERIRAAGPEPIRLSTVGAVLSLAGTALAVWFFLGASVRMSLLIGSLLVATGPTVITPLLQVVPVRERVATTLEMEGVVNDVTAAILAIVMFEYVLLEDGGVIVLLREFALRLGGGILVGTAIAGVIWYVLNYVDLSQENAPQNSRLIVLVSSLVMYGLGEMIASEAGLAAVATGGFLLGNTSIPYREEIEQFKGDLSLLVISFVFITLTSMLSIGDLLALGVSGIAVAVVVAGIVRPLYVLLCTYGGELTFNERLFVGAIGPRGIIPASVATLFALELQPTNPEAASILVGTVFLVIFTTVVVEGGLARHIAQALDVIPMRAIIIGGGRVGTALAERLEDRGEEVVIIEEDKETVSELRQQDYNVVHGDATSRDVLRQAGIENAKVVAAATGIDDVNLLISRHAANHDVETIVARVNEPDNREAFEDLEVEPISSPMSVAWSMDNIIERPDISRWMKEMDEAGDVQEIEVDSDDLVGDTVNVLMDDLPDGCHIALITRDGENILPTEDETIQKGDQITVIGHRESVQQALDACAG